MTNDTSHPDLYLLGGVSPALEAALAAHDTFLLHGVSFSRSAKAVEALSGQLISASLS